MEQLGMGRINIKLDPAKGFNVAMAMDNLP
jgi:hypothetical protein